jgi:hypothetical protein
MWIEIVTYFFYYFITNESLADKNKNFPQSSPCELAALQHFLLPHVVNDDLLDSQYFCCKVGNSLLNLFPFVEFLLQEGPVTYQLLKAFLFGAELLTLIILRTVFLFLIVILRFLGFFLFLTYDLSLGNFQKAVDVAFLFVNFFQLLFNQDFDNLEYLLQNYGHVVEIIKLLIKSFFEIVKGVGIEVGYNFLVILGIDVNGLFFCHH